jgi:hypothetical protein
MPNEKSERIKVAAILDNAYFYFLSGGVQWLYGRVMIHVVAEQNLG